MRRLFESISVHTLSFATLCLAAAVGVTACAGRTSSTSDGDAGVGDAGDTSTAIDGAALACNATMGQYLESFASCCSPADRETATYAAIVDRATGWCESYLRSSLDQARVRVDADRAATCKADVAAYLHVHPNCWPTPNRYPHPATAFTSAACKAAVIGLRAEGESCRVDFECSDGLTCVGWSNDSDGSCKRPPLVGETCKYAVPADTTNFSVTDYSFPFGAHPACAPGAYCDVTCKPLSAVGEACDTDTGCNAGLVCLARRCTAGDYVAEGGTCTYVHECRDGLDCVVPTQGTDPSGHCTARKSAGGACKRGWDCLGRCDTASGTCVAFCGAP